MKKKQLFSNSQKKYGNSYKEHLFEQYKLYVNSAERISDRRESANKYFITINTILISFIGIAEKIKLFQSFRELKAVFALMGIIICVIFWNLIRAHRQLNSGKFKVIHEIEKKLPMAIYDYEWRILEQGKNKKVYYPFSHIEQLIPWIFGLLYLFLGIIFIL